ncbi:DNA-directed RNA polymerase subunit omega [Alkalibacter rhizosphaerae]|uniref:DNA-directed RNA polymerase subunit omega n=1 Tax=Alkalibacter rhizosphaerae TaxID=2815577 RepID=A0A974XHG4_9FIRM|nr:DNA-directed RNA polymerase subunit omega [Alkalibacter rhizosphaerae]QSX08750.1 DNA-directed RNA polymerase subunit omega [Alkalibacter rhizosphaerae]
MRYPALNDLIEKTGNKYSLVLVVSKRARQIVDKNLIDETKIENPVSIATGEVAEDKLKFHFKG